ncbi:hypothetical protein QAD02_017572 [Eretmocerus hayati]|uniref:Uncharacterized protein n=1 Tax=Eretmocerus hayati TaxID=131215 RepID=A0ACC2PJ27_9HYME|nr:hypothetical protein QAD02_017572 [Eretmocerus hayati]
MEKLISMQCPFTWFFDDETPCRALKFRSPNEDELPLMQLMRNIMQRYVESILGSTLEEGEKILDATPNAIECDDYLTALEISYTDEQNFSHGVIRHIVQATYAFVFLRARMIAELEEILPRIQKVDMSNAIVKSTLFGCKAICWSTHAQDNLVEAQRLIRGAIDLNHRCHLWHFVLGRILRNQRRDFDYEDTGNEEVHTFEEAYSLSKCPTYGCFLAQAYRERNFDKVRALEIYEKLFRQEPTSTMLLLRLALGFMNLGEVEKGKDCLDKVIDPGEKMSMYLHYRGIYHFKKEQYEEAAKYFEDAARYDNIGADYQYIECKLKIDENFKKEVSKYLLNMTKKYRDFPKKHMQGILLNLAISYWKNDKNLEDSLRYLLQALEIDPRSKIFTEYKSLKIGVNLGDKNIFRKVQREFLPRIYEKYANRKYDCPEILTMANTLRNKYCADYERSISSNEN